MNILLDLEYFLQFYIFLKNIYHIINFRIYNKNLITNIRKLLNINNDSYVKHTAIYTVFRLTEIIISQKMVEIVL